MAKILVVIPDELLQEVNKVSKNKSDFIKQAIKEKLEKETLNLLI